jgi:hypothetical protein
MDEGTLVLALGLALLLASLTNAICLYCYL